MFSSMKLLIWQPSKFRNQTWIIETLPEFSSITSNKVYKKMLLASKLCTVLRNLVLNTLYLNTLSKSFMMRLNNNKKTTIYIPGKNYFYYFFPFFRLAFNPTPISNFPGGIIQKWSIRSSDSEVLKLLPGKMREEYSLKY